MARPTKVVTARDVFLFVPNIIGYTRVLLTTLAFLNADNIYVFYAFYFVSSWLDALDGTAARYFGQSSRFGAVLDMVTDRCQTAALICQLVLFFPQHRHVLSFCTVLDFASHYTHMYSTMMRGESSHKTVLSDQPWLLRLYYGNRLFLGTLCSINEGFFLTLYACHFTYGPELPFPFAVFGYRSAGVVLLFTLFCTPFMLAKQLVNAVQFLDACRNIATLDAVQLPVQHKQKKQSPARGRSRGRKAKSS